jgi:hypothetical protein
VPDLRELVALCAGAGAAVPGRRPPVLRAALVLGLESLNRLVDVLLGQVDLLVVPLKLKVTVSSALPPSMSSVRVGDRP